MLTTLGNFSDLRAKSAHFVGHLPVVPRGAHEKLEPMPVEDAGEREEKQRDEPSPLSSP